MAAKSREVMLKAYEEYRSFMMLCKVVFSGERVEDVHDFSDEKFLSEAKSIAKEFEMDWDNLSADDNIDILMAMLEDHFNRIQTSDEYTFTLQINVAEKKAIKQKGE